MFRAVINAIGDAEHPFIYVLVDFNENGTFTKRVVRITETKLRMNTGTRFANVFAGRETPLSMEEFNGRMGDWNHARETNGYGTKTLDQLIADVQHDKDQGAYTSVLDRMFLEG